MRICNNYLPHENLFFMERSCAAAAGKAKQNVEHACNNSFKMNRMIQNLVSPGSAFFWVILVALALSAGSRSRARTHQAHPTRPPASLVSVRGCAACGAKLYFSTTCSGGCLGSSSGEERSELRYAQRCAEFRELQSVERIAPRGSAARYVWLGVLFFSFPTNFGSSGGFACHLCIRRGGMLGLLKFARESLSSEDSSSTGFRL